MWFSIDSINSNLQEANPGVIRATNKVSVLSKGQNVCHNRKAGEPQVQDSSESVNSEKVPSWELKGCLAA